MHRETEEAGEVVHLQLRRARQFLDRLYAREARRAAGTEAQDQVNHQAQTWSSAASSATITISLFAPGPLCHATFAEDARARQPSLRSLTGTATMTS